jgi:hypothetical protein
MASVEISAVKFCAWKALLRGSSDEGRIPDSSALFLCSPSSAHKTIVSRLVEHEPLLIKNNSTSTG